MTAWKLEPVTYGPFIGTSVFAGTDPAHLVFVGELTLDRELYGDLAARLGGSAAFDTATGRPIPVSTVEPPHLWLTITVSSAVAEADLHDGLHPQPGEAPAAPLPDGVEGRPLGRAARAAEVFPDPSYREREGEGLS